MTFYSMTGFASGQGARLGYSWSWDIRSVNAKGLDVRVRCPEWLEGFETEAKKRIGSVLARGNVTLSVRLGRNDDTKGQVTVNASALEGALAAIAEVEAQAQRIGVATVPVKASDILAMRGVLETTTQEQDSAPIVKILLSEFDSLLASFVNARAAEGAALQSVLSAQLTQVATLCGAARLRADARKDQLAQSLKRSLAQVLDNSDGADKDRVAQELALIAVKSDVTEELDRLDAHVAAAHKLLGQGGPVGRKFDFLMQEFNREANTLCSKSQNAPLTEVGLELKTVIDQMREQVQNIE